jgi:hypothetical protein
MGKFLLLAMKGRPQFSFIPFTLTQQAWDISGLLDDDLRFLLFVTMEFA